MPRSVEEVKRLIIDKMRRDDVFLPKHHMRKDSLKSRISGSQGIGDGTLFEKAFSELQSEGKVLRKRSKAYGLNPDIVERYDRSEDYDFDIKQHG